MSVRDNLVLSNRPITTYDVAPIIGSWDNLNLKIYKDPDYIDLRSFSWAINLTKATDVSSTYSMETKLRFFDDDQKGTSWFDVGYQISIYSGQWRVKIFVREVDGAASYDYQYFYADMEETQMFFHVNIWTDGDGDTFNCKFWVSSNPSLPAYGTSGGSCESAEKVALFFGSNDTIDYCEFYSWARYEDDPVTIRMTMPLQYEPQKEEMPVATSIIWRRPIPASRSEITYANRDPTEMAGPDGMQNFYIDDDSSNWPPDTFSGDIVGLLTKDISVDVTDLMTTIDALDVSLGFGEEEDCASLKLWPRIKCITAKVMDLFDNLGDGSKFKTFVFALVTDAFDALAGETINNDHIDNFLQWLTKPLLNLQDTIADWLSGLSGL